VVAKRGANIVLSPQISSNSRCDSSA